MMRIAVLFVGAAATLLGIVVNSIYALWFLCSDLVYVILFPQFVLVVHTQSTNAYGSLLGFILGMILRFTGGKDYALILISPFCILLILKETDNDEDDLEINFLSCRIDYVSGIMIFSIAVICTVVRTRWKC